MGLIPLAVVHFITDQPRQHILLGYLTLDGMIAATWPLRQRFCTACYTGAATPSPVESEMDKFVMDKMPPARPSPRF